MLRPLMLRHVGRRLQHLVLADARLTDLAALSGFHSEDDILVGVVNESFEDLNPDEDTPNLCSTSCTNTFTTFPSSEPNGHLESCD